MKNTKLIIIIVLVVAVLLLIFQNTDYVRVTLLFFRLEMPMILLLLITTGIGFLIGLLVALRGKPKLK
ncbi:MAG TPA: LapA family protein [Bacteroidales bacterium]|mgnify:CR=1 FL=1|jgi:uncharacterized integral membrane protein|nr:LapA family protein [Bacteroidales bacterium]